MKTLPNRSTWPILAGLVLLSACTDDADSAAGGVSQCVPGEVHACACAAGAEGVQVCAEAGSFGPCSCAETDATSTGDAQTGTDADPTGDARANTPDAAACIPASEVCDGLDDDCDGVVDNGASCPEANMVCHLAACVPVETDACPLPAVAPVPLTQDSGAIVVLDASPSTDAESPGGRPTHYRWTVIEAPAGSSVQVVEHVGETPSAPYDHATRDDDTTPRAEIVPDLVGTYTLQLFVADSANQIAPSDACPEASEPSRVTFQVLPAEGIRVEMTWHTPGDPDEKDLNGADVDLHFLHPTGQHWSTDLDCYYANPVPDWGAVGDPTDNPSQILDDTNGAGPEIVVHRHPENSDALPGPYRVGVEYYRAESLMTFEAFGPSEITVAVYLQGMLAWQNEQPKVLERTHDFWEPVQIFWSDPPRVEVVDRLN